MQLSCVSSDGRVNATFHRKPKLWQIQRVEDKFGVHDTLDRCLNDATDAAQPPRDPYLFPWVIGEYGKVYDQ